MASNDQKLDELTKKVTKILFYLESDNNTNSKGLVEKFTELKEQVDSIVTEQKIFKAKAGVFGLLGGALLWLVKAFVTKII